MENLAHRKTENTYKYWGFGTQKDRVLYNASVDNSEDKNKVFHNTYMEDLIHTERSKMS